MDAAMQGLLKVAEETLTFDYQMGGVTTVMPHETGWRSLPSLVVCQLDYAVRVEGEGEEPVISRRGDAISLPPGLTHNLTMLSPGPSISRWAHVAYRVLGSVDLFSLIRPLRVLRGAAARRIGEINAALAEWAALPEPQLVDVFRRKALGFELLARVATGAELRPEALQRLRGARHLVRVLEYIPAHLAGDLGRDTLARLAHLSPSRFHTVFETALGKAPGQYVQEVRLRAAQQLLIATDLGVEEVGLRVGFADAFHFSRLFRKRCGLSPTHYRRRARPGPGG